MKKAKINTISREGDYSIAWQRVLRTIIGCEQLAQGVTQPHPARQSLLQVAISVGDTPPMSMSMSMWSLRWHFTNKSVTGAPYSIKNYSLSHSWTLLWRVRWLEQCRLEVAAELQQWWRRTNRRRKSIPRSSSSQVSTEYDGRAPMKLSIRKTSRLKSPLPSPRLVIMRTF